MKNILIVEGYSDMNVILSLLNQHDIDSSICEIKPRHGYENAIADFVANLYSSANATSVIGIVLDADKDVDSRYKEINKSLFSKFGRRHTDLAKLPEDGLVSTYNGHKIGIWIMPNCKKTGTLEDFLLDKMDARNRLFGEVTDALMNLENNAKGDSNLESMLYAPYHKNKALVRTFISWKEPPDLNIGDATDYRYFPRETETEKRFISWIKRLYNVDE